MPIEWKVEDDNVVEYQVSGQLGIQEYREFQAALEALIHEVGNIKMLALLKDFQGWEPGDGWEDTSFTDRNDPHIDKFAIVGDAKWHDLVTVFILKDLRPVPIEYFTPDQEVLARSWLASD